jgi:DNA (cytosine-5)-methyltransferase 1
VSGPVRTLVYGSVCSGIEAPTVAWEPLGWRARFFAEIAAFPSRVLAHHYPHVPNLGDFTRITESDAAGIDLLVGGTPCQSFSVAGLRGGLADERGALALEFLRLAARARPRWLVWENVPGVLSADGGRAFGSFLGGLAELGYGFAYRVLDAQYFGLAQRRSSLRGDPPPSREAGARVAGTLEARARSGGGWRSGPDEAAAGHLVAPALTIAGTLSRRNADTGGGARGGGEGLLVPVPVVIPFDTTQVTSAENRSRCEPGAPAPSLSRGAHAPAIAFHQTQDPIDGEEFSLALSGTSIGGMGDAHAAMVRRLTPRECERLMGFPDDYTAIPGAKDGPRYAALGNSIAVPVLRWIGERIARVDALGVEA